MWIVIILFVLPFIAFIALVIFIISRVRKSIRAQAADGAGKGKGFKDWDKMSRTSASKTCWPKAKSCRWTSAAA